MIQNKFIVFLIALVMLIATSTMAFAFELDQAFVEAKTPTTAVENLVDLEQYKNPTITVTVGGTLIDVGLGEFGLRGEYTTDLATPRVGLYVGELTFRFIDGDSFAAECYLSHSGDTDGRDFGQAAGCRAGLLGYN